jgi:hypothetical protein
MKTQSMKQSLFFLLALAPSALVAQVEPSPYQVPEGLVKGAAFIDLIEPMPIHDGLETDVWGGDNVKPRDAHNGLEDAQWSYWCNSIITGPDGREHMFACRWLESSPKGHGEWPRSLLVHAVGDSPTGPFKVVEEMGSGHNAEVYRAGDGTYVVYVIGAIYTSKSLDGPWVKSKLEFDIQGNKPVNLSNLTFARREDGTYLMVSRGGQVWLSEDGLKPFRMVRPQSVYPKIRGRFEDPVVWRDEVQYHLIVNDWLGRTAYYLRSRDGLDWVWDPGKAYDQDVVRHPDGSKEGWHKIERPKVRQDKYGRATHICFAVIDSPKDQDKGGDIHSSKSVVLPLTLPRRMKILGGTPITPETAEIAVEILAEPGFDPNKDLDLQSLRFGAAEMVNFGKGGKVLRTKPSGGNLVVTFDGRESGFKPEDFAAKLLGRSVKGGVVHGWARTTMKP